MKPLLSSISNHCHLFISATTILFFLIISINAQSNNTTPSSFGSHDLKDGTVSSFTISQDSNGNYQCNSLSLSQVELKIQDNSLTFSKSLSSDDNNKQTILTCYSNNDDTTGEKHTCQMAIDTTTTRSICLKMKNTLSSDKKLSLAINYDSNNCASNNFDIQAKCSNPTSLTSASPFIMTFNYDASSSINPSTLVGGIIALFLFGVIIVAGGAFGYWYFIQKRREKLLAGDNP